MMCMYYVYDVYVLCVVSCVCIMYMDVLHVDRYVGVCIMCCIMCMYYVHALCVVSCVYIMCMYSLLCYMYYLQVCMYFMYVYVYVYVYVCVRMNYVYECIMQVGRLVGRQVGRYARMADNPNFPLIDKIIVLVSRSLEVLARERGMDK